MKISNLIDKISDFKEENAPAILTGLAIAGVVATAVAWYQAGPKIKKIMEVHKDEMTGLDLNKDEMDEEEYKEAKKDICANTVKQMAPVVIPPILIAGATIGCAVASNKASAKKIAAASAAYEIASRSLADYKASIEEIVPKKAQEIKEKAAVKGVERAPIPDEKHVYSTGRGDVLCVDKYTKVYFRSSADEIDKAINRLSARVRSEAWVNLNDFYWELGVPAEKIPPVSSDIGWHDSDAIEGTLPIVRGVTYDDTGTIPVISIDYEVDPFFKEGGRFR